MSWRPHGHAKVNARSPRAIGICDRCGKAVQHNTLRWQWQWAGERLQNLRILVCEEGCLDIPQMQLRARILSPDPLPIYNSRPEPFTVTGFNYQGESNIVTTADNQLFILAADGVTVLLCSNNPIGTLP